MQEELDISPLQFKLWTHAWCCLILYLFNQLTHLYPTFPQHGDPKWHASFPSPPVYSHNHPVRWPRLRSTSKAISHGRRKNSNPSIPAMSLSLLATIPQWLYESLYPFLWYTESDELNQSIKSNISILETALSRSLSHHLCLIFLTGNARDWTYERWTFLMHTEFLLPSTPSLPQVYGYK